VRYLGNTTSGSTSEANNLELTFLGTGNAFSIEGRYWGSILINNRILLDASPIAVPHMKKLGLELSSLEYIFVTHFHADHFFGIPYILLDFAYLTDMKQPLNIIGPAGLEEKITNVTEIGFSGVTEKLRGKLIINYLEIQEPDEYSVNGLKFRAISMAHGSTKAFGYKLYLPEKTVAYTGDTGPCLGLEELATGTDIMIIEMSNPDDDVPGHMSMDKLQKLTDKVPDLQRCKIILNHVGAFSHTSTSQIPDNWLMPDDMDVLKF
jgi:ribonuclease BN (tRNA processing enzyme)